MAKIDEGDDRWIVTDRPDGRNVNNWHWSERAVTSWATSTLRALLVPRSYSDGNITVQLLKIDKVEGEAIAYIRKAKLKTICDLKITLDWEASPGTADDSTPKSPNSSDTPMSVSSTDEEGGGENEVPEKKMKKVAVQKKDDGKATKGTINFELFDDDPEITFKVDKAGDYDAAARGILKTRVVPFVRDQAREFIRRLHGGADIPAGELEKLTTCGSATSSVTIAGGITTTTTSSGAHAEGGRVCVKTEATSGASVSAKPGKSSLARGEEIRLSEFFRASSEDIYMALVDEERIKAYMMGKVESEKKEGGKFAIYYDGGKGCASGRHIKLQPGKRVIQEWRLKSFPDGIHSEVDFTIQENEGLVEVLLLQKGVPTEHKHEVEHFWKEQVFHRIKLVLGYSAQRFF